MRRNKCLIRRSSVAGIANSGARGHRPRLQLRRQHGRERHLAIDGLREDVLDSRAYF